MTTARPRRAGCFIGLLLSTIALGGQWCSPVGAQTTSAPFGVLDEVVSTDPGRILVRGWAVDPSDRAATATISVTVLGPDGAVTTYDTGGATRYRPDVGRAVFPGPGPEGYCDRACAADRHGFAVVLTEQLAGVSQVCVDAHLAGATTRLGCQLVRVAWASTHDPLGVLLSVNRLDGGSVQVRGWVVDVDGPGQPVIVHVYALQTEPWGSAYLGVDRDPCLLGPMSCLTGNPNFPRWPTPGMDAVANELVPPGVGGYDGSGFTKVVDRQEFTALAFEAARPLDPRLPTRVCAIAENVGPGRDALLGCRWVELIA